MSSHPYQIVGTRKAEDTNFFMLNSVLQARIETGKETTDDEDVNIYLANLLHGVIKPGGIADRSIVSGYDSDVAQMVDENDLRHRYRVYKANGDYALISTSLFEGPFLEKREGLSRQSGALASRGGTYYGFAANLSERINRSHPGITLVLRKLSERFDLYATILTRVRIGHLNLTATLSDAEMYHLEKDAHNGAKPYLASCGRDQFLDAYSSWMKTKSPLARQKVNELGLSLSKVDPDFAFQRL